MKELRLQIELVPSTSWLNNVRTIVSKEQWDYLRKKVYSEAWDCCEICGGVGKKHPVEAHEIWSYDDTKHIQKLERMIALCNSCHSVKHFGFARVSGKEKEALSHFMKINGLKEKEAKKYIDEQFKLWSKRSQFKWTLDINILNDYGIDVSKIKETSV